MTDRARLAQAFLSQTGWAGASATLLAGDASNRKYHRLTCAATGQTAVLMDAPPDKGEDVRPFVHIAKYLTGIGLSVPTIIAADDAHGFLLLEDLGDALFARVIVGDPALEMPLYTTATDVLIALHDQPPPSGLKPYGARMMSDLAALAFDWYAVGAGRADADARRRLHETFEEILARHTRPGDVLIQRDYHAENLLWLPDRLGVARVGLLDFQDAMIGHRAYDLVSLLQDARRDVSLDVERAMISRYVSGTRSDPDLFDTAYRCLGAQRNLRILGAFARLCIRDGKSGYIDMIPRVWGYLQNDLDHPVMAPIADIVRTHLPMPTPANLQILKDKCAIIPHQ